MIKPEPLQGDKERELQKVETTKKGGLPRWFPPFDSLT